MNIVFERAEKEAHARYKHLTKLVKLYEVDEEE